MSEIMSSRGRSLSYGIAMFALAALFTTSGCADAGDPTPSPTAGALSGDDSADAEIARRCTEDSQCGRQLTCEKQCDERSGVCVVQQRGCPDVWEPECGCDGRTYGNRCERIAAGVDLKSAGECGPRRCGPESRCGVGESCIYETGVCGSEQGVCTERPGGCPRIWEPVCGCDGETYSNECHAHQAGVSVSYLGVCGEPACASDRDCTGREEYCAFDTGVCKGDDSSYPAGVCTNRPRYCLHVWDPVCGCDGNSWGNACYAASAGVNVLHEGACETVCNETKDCPDPDGQVCKQDGCGSEGVCVPRPEGCSKEYAPVCGCDGKTYDNACFASLHGATVKSQGECRCDGRTGVTCGEGEFCDHDPGQCTIRDAEGVCVPVGDYCLAVYDPVCGCDGVTYSNDCVRIQAGVQKVHDGACECPPVCAIFCPHGHVPDANGCATCACLPGPGGEER